MTSILNIIKRYWLYLPMLFISPLGYFLGSYFEGSATLPGNMASYICVISLFFLPFVVSTLFVFIFKGKWFIRILIFISIFIAQCGLISITPPEVAAEMMGIAHRLSFEFPPDQIRDCANHLRQKHRDGTLKEVQRGNYSDVLMSDNAIIIDDSELPVSLRGRFVGVYIRSGLTSPDDVVVFALGMQKGIICDNRKYVSEFYFHSMGDGVHAYRFQRL
ncbi:MAG: hypothetical protein ACHQYP_11700 [Nitrospiria bacterium]